MAIYHIKYPGGGERFGVIDDDADTGAIQKILRGGDMTKGRPTTPAKRDPAAAPQPSSELALAHLKDAVWKHDRARRAGSTSEIEKTREEMVRATDAMKSANAHERTLAATRLALAKPLRLF